MKITSIKQQLKNSDRASIFIDGKYSFSLNLNELVQEKLKLNQEIDDTDLKKLKKLSDEGKIKARALEWIMNRPRSRREFRDYLYRKKVESELTASLMEGFEQRGYLSETNFAKWLTDMLRRRGKSERAIKNELMKKGIERDIITETLKQEVSNEHERLKTIIEKKAHLSRYKADPQKLKQYLFRQGFNYDDINNLLLDSNKGRDG